ncbi:13912_t:CDS:2, partial [Funneliformis mosseae]
PELSRIILHNWRLNDLISYYLDNRILVECLKFIQPRMIVRSLTAYDNFKYIELAHFLQIYHLEIDDTITEYYNAAYDSDFVTIAELISAETFGSTNIPRFYKNSFILARFIHDNNICDVYSSQVQFYFEHEVNLPD